MNIARTEAWQRLKQHAREMKRCHLRDLLKDARRSKSLVATYNRILLDYSRQNVTRETMGSLFALARTAGLKEKMRAMVNGEKINKTEGRAVLHTALRAPRGAVIKVDGSNVMPDVHAVLDKIRIFAGKVRSGGWRGITGKPLTDVVTIGIGGSYLGTEFVHEALRNDSKCAKRARGRRLRFLSNVDPVDVARAIEGLNPETTLVIVVSKSFTTAETILNAKTVRQWLAAQLGASAVRRHMIAISTNTCALEKFGIDPENAFSLWDWVGGRFSVCSAVGVLPLSLQYGFETAREFLRGARDMDEHFFSSLFKSNLPVIMGLLGAWNTTFLGRPCHAILPYSQALHRFPAHVQQVAMESNGKRVDVEGHSLPYDTGEIVFGEPGTNGQHSFYQLMHQGRVIPADFIGFRRSQQPRRVKGESLDNHDELMANFFAQPDALALGKTRQECEAEGIPAHVLPHKVFPGNRPSNVILMDSLVPFSAGQLLALYEHRTAVQGFIWGINSFDQMGVELGKELAKHVQACMAELRNGDKPTGELIPSTRALIEKYTCGGI